MKITLCTDEIRAILAAYLLAQGLPIEPDAKPEFVALDADGEEFLTEFLRASFAIREGSQR